MLSCYIYLERHIKVDRRRLILITVAPSSSLIVDMQLWRIKRATFYPDLTFDFVVRKGYNMRNDPMKS